VRPARVLSPAERAAQLDAALSRARAAERRRRLCAELVEGLADKCTRAGAWDGGRLPP